MYAILTNSSYRADFMIYFYFISGGLFDKTGHICTIIGHVRQRTSHIHLISLLLLDKNNTGQSHPEALAPEEIPAKKEERPPLFRALFLNEPVTVVSPVSATFAGCGNSVCVFR